MSGTVRSALMMRKREVIQRLREHADAIKAIGASSLYLFGSTVRNEAADASDVDLFVDDDEDGDFSAIELMRIKHYVSDLLHADADVTTRAGLHPLIRDDIVASAERIF
jgi:predicted nucleotidyltransferase